MKKRRARFLYSVGLCVTLVSATVFGALTVAADKAEDEAVSPALSVKKYQEVSEGPEALSHFRKWPLCLRRVD